MIFQETIIGGVWLVHSQPKTDDRGAFSRAFCSDEFAKKALLSRFEQTSISSNHRAGTLRGLHYSLPPFSETKFVRCVRGAIFDVAVDVRDDSPTRGQWISAELNADNQLALYISPGIAHGFQTLMPDSDVLYQISPSYQPGYDAGVRWNDPAFKISWPIAHPFLSDRDANYGNWKP